MRDLVRESSRHLLEEFEDPSDLLARPNGKNFDVLAIASNRLQVLPTTIDSCWSNANTIDCMQLLVNTTD